MRRAGAVVNRTRGRLDGALGGRDARPFRRQGRRLPPSPIRFDEVRTWVFDKALPLWSTAGLDLEHGGAVEVLGGPPPPFKRTRVQARQVYAFRQADLLGWPGPAADAAEHCWRFLARHGRHEDGAWARSLGREGGKFDPAVDAYDMAFVLYALAWRFRAGETGALMEAHATLEALDRRLAVAPGLGWRTAEDISQFDQNPHMHLLEAALELADAAGDERFADMAQDIMMLFAERLFDPALGMIPEKFDAGWTPVIGARREVWPGHLYEWASLLFRARQVVGADLTDEARALYAWAERHGPDPETRLVDDVLSGEELTRRRSFRAWPQTEALRAHLVMFEQGGVDTRGRIAEVTTQLLDLYLATAPAGSWRDQLGPELQPLAPAIPASMLYHYLGAFTELMRLQPQLCEDPLRV